MRQPCHACAIWPCLCGAEAPRDMADYDDACDGLIPPYLPDNGRDCGNGATLFHPASITSSE